MNRREFMERGAVVLAAAKAHELVGWPAESAPGQSPYSWFSDRPVIIAGNWDDMPIFRIRKGGGPSWGDDDYRAEHTEEAVQKLHDLGVTMAIIHFFKGFGLQAERPHIEDARKLTALCHRLDIKVGVYVGSTIAYETFLLETPEAKDWFVPDFLGKPVVYGRQNFRKRVYFMHPGYRDYIKRVLKVALEEVKADLIHFDNTSMQAQPPIFQHPLAIQHFREFLASTYPPDALEKRFGFRDPKYVLPPQLDSPLPVIDDPVYQDWTRFRCLTLGRYYQEMADYIHSLNPSAVLDSNPHTGLAGENTYWLQGVDYPQLLAPLQAVWSEEGNAATVTSDGILVSKIRTYKMAVQLGNKIFTYTGVNAGPPENEAQMRIEMAEAMTYNRQCLGMIAWFLSAHELPETARKYVRFFTEQFHLYRNVTTVADVAVLHSFASLAFNNGRPYDSTWLIEQALIQAKVPFTIVFDLKDLGRYRALVLADQECLSDEEVATIREAVANGLGVVATGLASLYTPERKWRRDFGLSDVLHVHAQHLPEGIPGANLIQPGPPIRNHFAKGRAVYIPEVKPSITRPDDQPMSSKYWKLPLNWEEIIESVKWAAGSDLSLEVQAPLTVVAELLLQNDGEALLLHLINYDAARHSSVKDILVRLKWPSKDGGVKQVSLYSPDGEGRHSLQFTAADGQVNVSIPSLQTYCVVRIA